MTLEIPSTTPQPPKGADPRLQSTTGRSLPLTTLIFAGGLTAALFGSRILLQEIQSQPDMLFYQSIKNLGTAWNKTMQVIGTATPDRMLHDAIRRAESQTLKSEK